jgi:hypothetical protein
MPTLELIHAASAPISVILRRGPSKHVCCILWNRARDEFEVGQWLRGRIHAHKSNLSPDGTHLVYAAIDPRSARTYSRWTAISRPPFLTALALWPHRTTWVGGGRFLDPRHYYLFEGPGQRSRELLQKATDLVDVTRWEESRLDALVAAYEVTPPAEELDPERYSVEGGVLFRGTDPATREPIRDFSALQPARRVAPYDDGVRPNFDPDAIGDW